MKLEKIEKEMQKTREKIAEYQNRLKELDGQRVEIENLQIVQAVRAMRLTRDELAAFMRGEFSEQQPVPVMPTTATTTGTSYYTTDKEQEDSEDEE